MDRPSACTSQSVSSRLAAQETNGVWNAVVTTFGKGTFLIRRATILPANACPLRAYEVRHIAAGPPLVRKRAVNPAGRPARNEIYQDLLVRIRTGRI